MWGRWLRATGRALARNLTTRLVILLMLALMVITGVNDYARLVRVRERLVEQTRKDQRIFAETLAVAVRQNVRRGRTTDELQELLEDILTRPGLVAVVIFNPDSQVIAARIASGYPTLEPDETLRQTIAQRKPITSLVQAEGEQILRYIQPFRWPGGRSAAIEVRQTLGEVEREFRRAVRESIVSRAVILLLFVLSMVGLTRWNIGRPIRLLMAGARAIGKGDLAQRIAVRRRDEIGQLAEEFNRMAENLQAAHDELLFQAEERLRLEGEVHQTQKLAAVGMLAAEVAHEIGTPLNVISGRSEVLQGAISTDRPERRHIDVILRQTERINGIIRALLDYARPRRPALRSESVDGVIRRVADLLFDRCRRRGVRLVTDLPPDLPRVMADPDQMQQLFINLILNALDASPNGAEIRITSGSEPLFRAEGRARVTRGKAADPSLAIHILDRGKGLAPEQLDHVFEPFFSTKGREQGTGLGLPIVEEIVRAHRGEIEMLSTLGSGTEVIVRLPLAEEAAGGHEEAVVSAGREVTHEA
jgi:two-component system, NtrC family, sensor kinase